MTLKAKISNRSKRYAGMALYPHLHEDGMYVASHSRFKVDYIKVETQEQLEFLVKQGYGARMSNSEITNAPSFIVNKKIEFDEISHDLKNVLSDAVKNTDLDVDSLIKRRTEQSLLRAHLLKGSVKGKCTLCGCEFPENMLVAAHIKKRSKCSKEEKLDFDNIATLMCKLGCDDLFEKKYVYADDGFFVGNYKVNITEALKKAIKSIEGNVVSNWNGSKKYYHWHSKQSI